MKSGVQPRGWSASVLPALLLLFAGCGGVEKFPQTSLVPRSDFAREIDGLFWLTVILGSLVALAVFVVSAYIMLRFRYRPEQPEPKQVHGNTTLELAWTLIPAVLLAIIAVPTVNTIFATQPTNPPPNALEVDVVGWQWWWEFKYPTADGDTLITANEIHVPVGTPIALRLRGGDVIHSFWVPQMGGKRDVIPNRVNTILFTPEEPGVYLGQCAEFCGESHALMKMRLIAHTPAGFQRWVRNEYSPAVAPFDPAPTLADSAILLGSKLFASKGCIACHTIDGLPAAVGRLGPNLTHLASRHTIAAGILENNTINLERWINNPQAVKPGALMENLGWTPREVEYIVAYLQTLQ